MKGNGRLVFPYVNKHFITLDPFLQELVCPYLNGNYILCYVIKGVAVHKCCSFRFDCIYLSVLSIPGGRMRRWRKETVELLLIVIKYQLIHVTENIFNMEIFTTI